MLYEINAVIGPDEYHERVDNNAYTNFMAAWNLRTAAVQVERMRNVHRRSHLLRDLRVTDEETHRWQSIADAIRLPIPGDDGVLEQHEGFFTLARDVDPKPLSALTFPASERARMRRIRKAQILKQPDVIMLMVLFPELFSRKLKLSNWNYYEPRTTHDSSLSPGVHAFAACGLGWRDAAYKYFRHSAFVDLHDTMDNSATGLHLAAMGGTWQAVARGFLGLRLDGSKPLIRARLPLAWKRLAMRIHHRDVDYQVEATQTSARIFPTRSIEDSVRSRIGIENQIDQTKGEDL